MEFLSDDPTYLAAVLGLAALVFVVLLKMTQQGRYLIYAGVAVVLLLVLLAIERAWVTDAERIENVVYGLADAVQRSNAADAYAFLAPECRLEASADSTDLLVRYVSRQLAGPVTLQKLEDDLPRYTFDYVKVTHLRAHAGAITRMGTADFVVHTMGMQKLPSPVGMMTPPQGMAWSLGFREVTPGVWKVTRITPGRRGNDGR
jgi:hypothetical protein